MSHEDFPREIAVGRRLALCLPLIDFPRNWILKRIWALFGWEQQHLRQLTLKFSKRFRFSRLRYFCANVENFFSAFSSTWNFLFFWGALNQKNPAWESCWDFIRKFLRCGRISAQDHFPSDPSKSRQSESFTDTVEGLFFKNETRFSPLMRQKSARLANSSERLMSRKIPKMENADALQSEVKAKPQTAVRHTIERKNLIVHWKLKFW